MIKNRANFSSRKYVVIAIFSVVVLVLLIKLFMIQVVDQSYKHSSDNNTLRYITQYPARGKVYDRNGRLMVYNEAIYDLMVIPRQVKNLDTLDFCSSLDITREFFQERMAKARRYSTFSPSVFLAQITKEEYGKIAENLHKYPGP